MHRPKIKKSIPIFWQLYIGIIATLSLIAAVLVAFVIYQDEKTSVEDFYLDVSIVADKALNLWQQNELSGENIRLLEDLTAFDIKVLEAREYRSLIAGLTFVEEIEGVEIYANSQRETYVSVHSLRKNHQSPVTRLVLEDRFMGGEGENLTPMQYRALEIELQEEETSARVMLYLILSVLCLVGFTLLALVHRLKTHINKLVETSEQWGLGNFKAKADESAPLPLGALAVRLNLTSAELAKVIQEQKIMMHAMSHELRNPLNAFQLALEMLKRKHPELIDERLLGDLENYADELERLTSEILQLARMSHDRENQKLESVELGQLVEQRVSQLQGMFPDIKVRVDIHQSINIELYVLYMQLALDNLLSNAFKYAGAQIKVTLDIDGHRVRLVIEDDGPGIPEDKREQVRLAFSRLDESRNRKTGGFGLGLAITQAAIDKHMLQHASLLFDKSELGGLKAIVSLDS